MQCLRCGCTGTIGKDLSVVASCSCLCCHYKDSSCVYTGIDQCADCNGKYSLHGGKSAWTSPYFSCDKHCLRTSKSPLSDHLPSALQNHLNNVRNTMPATQKTLLHSAVLAGDPDLTWDLLCRGANPFVKDRLGVTPIDLARLMLSAVRPPMSPRSSGSFREDREEECSEQRIVNLLPKQAYPEAAVEFPPVKLRTRSDFGPDMLAPSACSSPLSPRRLVHKSMAAPPQTDRHGDLHRDRDRDRDRPFGVRFDEASAGVKSGAGGTGGSESVLGGEGGGGAGQSVAAPPCPPASSGGQSSSQQGGGEEGSLMYRRRRANTLTLSTQLAAPSVTCLSSSSRSSSSRVGVPESWHYPPSPPRMSAHHHHHHHQSEHHHPHKHHHQSDHHHKHHKHPTTPPSTSPRQHRPTRGRASSLSLSPRAAASTASNQPPALLLSPGTSVAAASSYGFARRQRGMSLTEPPLPASTSSAAAASTAAAVGDTSVLLAGIVNAGIRHARANAPQLAAGTQMFSPLTLLRMNSGNDFVMEDQQQLGGGGRLHWEMTHLKSEIVAEQEVQGTVPASPTTTDDPQNPASASSISTSTSTVSCTCCLDELLPAEVQYCCPRLDCAAHLCRPCLFRLVFVTVTSALYAVPVIRCPGRCMRGIPTRRWRGGLQGLAVTEDDREGLKVGPASTVRLLDLLYEAFEALCLDYEQEARGEAGDVAARIRHTCAVLSRVQDVALADGFTLAEVYSVVPPAESGSGSDTDTDSDGEWGSDDSSEWEDDSYEEKQKQKKKQKQKQPGSNDNDEEEEEEDDDDAEEEEDGDAVAEVSPAPSLPSLLSSAVHEASEQDSGAQAVRAALHEHGECVDSDVDDGSGEGSDCGGDGNKDASLKPEQQTDSAIKYTTFAEFAAAVQPGREVAGSEAGACFMRLEDILNDSEVESARLNVRQVRKTHMYNFLAELAVLVRTRMDVSVLGPGMGAGAGAGAGEEEREGAEQLLMRRYLSNAQALLMIRCSGCDETASLLHVVENGKPLVTSVAERAATLESITSGIDTEDNALAFLRAYSNFMSGRVPSSLFVTAVFEAFLHTRRAGEDDEQWERRCEDQRKAAKSGVLKSDAAKHVTRVLSLVLDVERRFSAQLEQLRRFPKVKLLCCGARHCFLCKVGGHHKGQSCAEVQRAEVGGECQYCPGCGVATVRSEGCLEVLCVCGAVWKWAAEGGAASDSEGDWGSSDGSGEDY